MGLAASQARLLLLTARKSDLEFRAQQITNSEMMLAMQTEQVAREYSIKISNQAIFYTDGSSADQATQCLSAADIALLGAGGMFTLYELGADGMWHEWTSTPTTTTEKTYKNADGDVITESQYNHLEDAEKGNWTEILDASGNPQTTTNTTKGCNYNELQLLEGIKNGTLKIMNAKGEEMSLSGNNGFTQSYYTDDDREAEAEYEQKTASIQVKEKRLQNDLNQVETQQKACDTEIDSVNKVLEKNIERTFKVFS